MERKRILCFGDSLTWGYDPEKRTRIDENRRWTGVLQALLGDSYKVIEEGHNGRTIATDDPAEGEKNGLKYVIPCIESQSPVNVMIIMLGTNDLKRKFSYCSMDIAGEMQIFLEKVQAHNRFRMNDKMQILLVSPPLVGTTGKGSWLEDCFDFLNAARVSSELAIWYKQLAEMYNCAFLDASKIVSPSPADGVHIDADAHGKLGKAIYDKLHSSGLLGND
ncbi:SGNH/GDSL hydrolase family protein [Butyrivibrio sp. AC2005]|uniref:SGNH/GDSL hydrolase family protein n=1 Tax=Butyrivibrio sp. AC2005 TaxID=1280672 RepID=UPI0004148734|nr:SGNH/GDSL hydrolase family protein [Butyrivibrio sp. AC2005]